LAAREVVPRFGYSLRPCKSGTTLFFLKENEMLNRSVATHRSFFPGFELSHLIETSFDEANNQHKFSSALTIRRCEEFARRNARGAASAPCSPWRLARHPPEALAELGKSFCWCITSAAGKRECRKPALSFNSYNDANSERFEVSHFFSFKIAVCGRRMSRLPFFLRACWFFSFQRRTKSFRARFQPLLIPVFLGGSLQAS
jgi:hypothetical protein